MDHTDGLIAVGVSFLILLVFIVWMLVKPGKKAHPDVVAYWKRRLKKEKPSGQS